MNDTPTVIPPMPPRWVGVADRGQTVYAEKIRPQLTEADKGKYLIINVETGEWVMDVDLDKASDEAHGRFPRQLKYRMRIGYRAVIAFPPAVNTELAEW